MELTLGERITRLRRWRAMAQKIAKRSQALKLIHIEDPELKKHIEDELKGMRQDLAVMRQLFTDWKGTRDE